MYFRWGEGGIMKVNAARVSQEFWGRICEKLKSHTIKISILEGATPGTPVLGSAPDTVTGELHEYQGNGTLYSWINVQSPNHLLSHMSEQQSNTQGPDSLKRRDTSRGSSEKREEC